MLRALSRQSGVEILTTQPSTVRVPHPIRGRMTLAAAIARALAGLPLAARAAGGGYVVVPGVAAPAAEPPPAPEPPLIVVTGYREAVRQSIALKRRATGVREATRAQDIAEFPDRNVADALQRLPGVAISRDNGEGRQVSLRGLGPLFTRTTLNGVDALATTASGLDNRGSVSRERRFDYSVFEASLLSQVVVEKAWAADADAGGIGGTVALQTVRPFDRPGNETLVSLRARSGGNGMTTTPQGTVVFSRRSAQWGVLVAASFSSNHIAEFGYRNWDWVPITFGAANLGPEIAPEQRARLTGASGSPVYGPRAATYSSWFNRLDRRNLVAAVQHAGDDGSELALDWVHAALADHRDERSLAAAGDNGLTGDVTGTQRLLAATIVGDTLAAARYSGVDLRTEAKKSEDRTRFDQAALSLHKPIDAVTSLQLALGYNRSVFHGPVFDKAFLQANNQRFATISTGAAPQNSYGFDPADPAAWSLMRADAREDAIDNSNGEARLTLDRTLAPEFTLRLGGSWHRFTNSGYQRRTRVDYPDGGPVVEEVFDGATIAPYVVADVDATYAALGQRRDLTAADNVPGTDYRLREESRAGFALLDWDGRLGTLPLRVRMGLRYEAITTRSTGAATSDLLAAPVTHVTESRAWLPSLEARLTLRPDLLLRATASENVNRPDLADLRAAAVVSVSPFGGTITTGNPDLKPFRAQSFDLALERYGAKGGLIAIGVFYKHMNSFITSATTVQPYVATGYPLAFLFPGQSATTLFNVIQPFNGGGAAILGAELAVQQELRFLPAPLDRAGVQLNGTYADGRSDVVYAGVPVRLTLIDLSRWQGNATLYYTGRGWDARVALAYRDRYRTAIGNSGNIGEWIAPAATLDAAAHLALGKRAKLVLEAQNLTNARILQYTDRDARRLLAITHSGRVLSAGVRYAF
ncbi:TonB-dependent receptor [Sphingomonas azotifigens]|uniref:TonB-dependent receptor n=1 Tax=Sphingomonas azotifigens TaxID=330920 RepID=UPI00111C480B|nr:TonB-dependent receptor [Sphingomonas azotifigens]